MKVKIDGQVYEAFFHEVSIEEYELDISILVIKGCRKKTIVPLEKHPSEKDARYFILYGKRFEIVEATEEELKNLELGGYFGESPEGESKRAKRASGSS
jgi:hypothetical protein